MESISTAELRDKKLTEKVTKFKTMEVTHYGERIFYLVSLAEMEKLQAKAKAK